MASSVKNKTVFFCQNCGYESVKWMGQCPSCHEWNTFAEEPVATGSSGNAGKHRQRTAPGKPVRLADISMEKNERAATGMKELDRVLGGGIVKGSLILIGGDPGIGKSTLLLQVCRNLAENGRKVLYISGEESLQQIKMRAQRIGEVSDSLLLLCETNLSEIQKIIENEKPDIVILVIWEANLRKMLNDFSKF